MPFSSTSTPRYLVHVCRLRPANVIAALSARSQFLATTWGSETVADSSRNLQNCSVSVYATGVVDCPVKGPVIANAAACRSSGELSVEMSWQAVGVLLHWNAKFVLTSSPPPL